METEEPSSEPDVVDSREEVVFVSMEPVVGESVVAVEDDVVVAEEFPAPKVLSLRELLGDTVADQFDRIDAGLDALDDLVASIEENLILLTDYERGTDDSDSAEKKSTGLPPPPERSSARWGCESSRSRSVTEVRRMKEGCFFSDLVVTAGRRAFRDFAATKEERPLSPARSRRSNCRRSRSPCRSS